jgi:hypothetical protein
MAELDTDENFPLPTVVELRLLGHDVLRAQDAGQAGQKIPDPQVLAFAISQGRAVVTLNYRHFVKLHKQATSHCGIVVCTRHTDFLALGQRIHQAILANTPLPNKLVRVNKPQVP